MTTLKQGDLITHLDSDKLICKVMEVCGTILHISYSNDHDSYNFSATESQLKADGYTWDTPAWEPAYDEMYWFGNSQGEATLSRWNNDKFDHERRDFLGIHQTKELAEAALLEIRRKLGK